MKAFFLEVILRFFAGIPLPLSQRIGCFLGQLLAFFPNRSRKVAQKNLSLCFPNMEKKHRYEMLKGSLCAVGQSITELGAFWFWKPDKILSLVKEVQGGEVFNEALRESQGRGLILLTPHLGAWELAGLYASSGRDMAIMYKPQGDLKVDKLIANGRRRVGATLAPTTLGGVKAASLTLRRGGVVGILPDQEPDLGEGVFAPFFGLPAYTMTLVTRLARKKRLPIVFLVMERLAKGKGYCAHYIRAHEGVYDGNESRAVETINQLVEQCVNIAPKQYMWNYKRFRRRPDGSKMNYG